jgi:hypothetical protein
MLAVSAGRASATGSDALIGAWLPDPDSGFGAWSKGQTSFTQLYDYFVCGSPSAPRVGMQDFNYAAGRCSLIRTGTPFAYGTAGPIKGNVQYDRSRGIVFYDKGCCAWRGFALTSKLGAPPSRVSSADLGSVHTMRGIFLGMTRARVEQIYGPATSHAAKGSPNSATLSYTTFKGTPKTSTQACGQVASFSFRDDRLVSIELLAGC